MKPKLNAEQSAGTPVRSFDLGIVPSSRTYSPEVMGPMHCDRVTVVRPAAGVFVMVIPLRGGSVSGFTLSKTPVMSNVSGTSIVQENWPTLARFSNTISPFTSVHWGWRFVIAFPLQSLKSILIPGIPGSSQLGILSRFLSRYTSPAIVTPVVCSTRSKRMVTSKFSKSRLARANGSVGKNSKGQAVSLLVVLSWSLLDPLTIE
mmetsp:Transcript_26639/g.40874  ORF Transcript_26639/g.40874 Transcript_26639/m.40874 type:complete len:204 (-) Transcript_26639:55-666(-)